MGVLYCDGDSESGNKVARPLLERVHAVLDCPYITNVPEPDYVPNPAENDEPPSVLDDQRQLTCNVSTPEPVRWPMRYLLVLTGSGILCDVSPDGSELKLEYAIPKEFPPEFAATRSRLNRALICALLEKIPASVEATINFS